MFKVGDRVELISSSYEDGGHYSGDIGKVVDKTVTNHGRFSEQDIRVRWENGAEECWISAEDFTEA